MTDVRFSLNGEAAEVDVEPRELLLDTLRDRLSMTGAHAACEQGACGACTVLVGGASVRSCLMFTVQVNGAEVRTIEGVGSPGALHPIQQALSTHHGLQCCYCTPGMVLTALEMFEADPHPSRDEIVEWMSGNLCRCTGYINIVGALEALAGTAEAQS
ncbi:MAG: (2Fe-2S)-binding protein [Acidimicrobiia bacterium]|nr:(2Fe-2S)-binding protein [Acidimicrobiia bacterium]